jgi:hypothetical protein
MQQGVDRAQWIIVAIAIAIATVFVLAWYGQRRR